jgi:membrane protein DedA with SNARE-associated domain
MAETLVKQLGYFGIVLVLVLGGLGLPVPEEAPVILAAVLSRRRAMWWPTALASCFTGVMLGDMVVYALGYFYGEKVLRFRLTRKFLTKPREAQIKGYFHRHGIKILVLGRFAVGFRTAAYLTAGILRLPPLRLLLADLCAATLTTLVFFGLGYWFAQWIETGLREVQHYAIVIAASAFAVVVVYRHYRDRQRAGLPVGPPVPVTDDVPLPPDDLHPAPLPAPLLHEPVSPPPPPAEPEAVSEILVGQADPIRVDSES